MKCMQNNKCVDPVLSFNFSLFNATILNGNTHEVIWPVFLIYVLIECSGFLVIL